jgi:hypothetical protein
VLAVMLDRCGERIGGAESGERLGDGGMAAAT